MMKRSVLFAVLVGLVLLPVTGVYADTVAIALGVNGGAPSLFAGPASSPAIASGSVSGGGWSVTAQVFGTPPNPEPTLESGTVAFTDTSGGIFSVQVYATEINITSPTGINSFISGLTSNLILGNINVTETTFVDPTNTPFSTPAGGLLSTHTFVGPSGSQSLDLSATTPSLSNPFSETEVFNIAASGVGQTNDTISITAAPEPGTLALFGTGLIGLAGLVRRKLLGA